MQSRGNQVALMDVLGTGDNLHRLRLSHVHLTNPHMVGIGVAHHGQNFAHHHILDFRVHPLIGFHLLTEDGEGFHEFFIGYMGKINEFLVEPFSVELHLPTSS